MLAALVDRAKWLDASWSSFGATAASDPAELLARVAARHGAFVVATVRAREVAPLGVMLATQAARDAWRYALAAVAIDELIAEDVEELLRRSARRAASADLARV